MQRMPQHLTAKQCHARYLALIEASEHLKLCWTHDATEIEEGNVMAGWLEQQADQWHQEAQRRGFEEE